MNPVIIHKSIEIAASPDQVWPRIGTAAGLREWWGVEIDMEEREGGHFAESGQHNGQPYRQLGEVLTYDPPRRLLIRLHVLGVGIEWPRHTEVEITLEEKLVEADRIYTTVSIVHRAFIDETDAVATENFMPIQPNANNTYGPTMMLPQTGGMVGMDSTTTAIQVANRTSVTLHELYQWRANQEHRWDNQCAALTNAFR